MLHSASVQYEPPDKDTILIAQKVLKSALEKYPAGRRERGGEGVLPLRAPKGNLVPNHQIDVV